MNELKLYMPGLVCKPLLICANKMDEPDAVENLKSFQSKVKDKVYPISCVSDEGLEDLKAALLEEVLNIRAAEAGKPNRRGRVAPLWRRLPNCYGGAWI